MTVHTAAGEMHVHTSLIFLLCPFTDLWQHLQKVLSDFLSIIFIGFDDEAQSFRCQNMTVQFIALVLLEFLIFLIRYLFHSHHHEKLGYMLLLQFYRVSHHLTIVVLQLCPAHIRFHSA